jgi:predicted dehydrogenase
MRNKRYGVLIHGAGWVSTQHIAAFKNNPHTQVVAISNRSLAGAQRRAIESGVPEAVCYGNLQTALGHPGVDIVAICTPQHVHCENVISAAKAGKHLLIEKPVAVSMKELRRMQQAVKRAGVKTLVSFVLRWNPLFQEIKRLIAKGALGTVYSVEADYLSHNGYWWSGWKETCTAKNGVSAMLVAGCHAIDALRWFAAPGQFEAANPVEVFSVSGGYRKGRTDDYNPMTNSWVKGTPPMEYDGLEIALVRFDNGVVGKVSVNFDCIMPYRFPIRIFGDRGTVMDNRVWSHKFRGEGKWKDLPQIQPDSSEVKHHPFQAEIDHFVECLRRGVESHCNLSDAIKTHEVVFAALECYRTRKSVRIRA